MRSAARAALRPQPLNRVLTEKQPFPVHCRTYYTYRRYRPAIQVDPQCPLAYHMYLCNPPPSVRNRVPGLLKVFPFGEDDDAPYRAVPEADASGPPLRASGPPLHASAPPLRASGSRPDGGRPSAAMLFLLQGGADLVLSSWTFSFSSWNLVLSSWTFSSWDI
mgnify:CR=1 FL=1